MNFFLFIVDGMLLWLFLTGWGEAKERPSFRVTTWRILRAVFWPLAIACWLHWVNWRLVHGPADASGLDMIAGATYIGAVLAVEPIICLMPGFIASQLAPKSANDESRGVLKIPDLPDE